MTLTKVATVADVPAGKLKAVMAGAVKVMLANLNGTFYAFQNDCTHSKGPLASGKLDGTTVTCPWHGAQFNLTNGAVLRGPATKPLTQYPVKMQGDEIWVDA